MPDDEIPEAEPMEPGLLDQLDVMFSKATAQTLIEVTKERDELVRRLEGHERALAEVTAERDDQHAQARSARAQWTEDLKDAVVGLEQAVRSGYAQALKNVHEYKWPHRGGPTEDEFSDFYAAIEAAGR